MSLWIHASAFSCAIDRDGGLHAASALRRKSRRKTYDTACGKRARLLVFPTIAGGRVTVAWPPYLKEARTWGFERCRACMDVAPGQPQSPPFVPTGEVA